MRFIAFVISMYGPAFTLPWWVSSKRCSLSFITIAAWTGAALQPLPAFIMGLTFELLREAGIRMETGRAGGKHCRRPGFWVKLPSGQELRCTNGYCNRYHCNMQLYSDTALICCPLPDLLIAANVWAYRHCPVNYCRVGSFVSLRSFGVHLWRICTSNLSGLKDTFIRAPLWTMFTRPKELTGIHPDQNRVRMALKIFPEDDDENE